MYFGIDPGAVRLPSEAGDKTLPGREEHERQRQVFDFLSVHLPAFSAGFHYLGYHNADELSIQKIPKEKTKARPAGQECRL